MLHCGGFNLWHQEVSSGGTVLLCHRYTSSCVFLCTATRSPTSHLFPHRLFHSKYCKILRCPRLLKSLRVSPTLLVTFVALRLALLFSTRMMIPNTRKAMPAVQPRNNPARAPGWRSVGLVFLQGDRCRRKRWWHVQWL